MTEFQIRTGMDAMQFDRVHRWLASTYWSPGISREKVERAAQRSALVIGAFVGEIQCGYARIVSDGTTFAWVCDVYVDAEYRGNGLARRMVTHAMDDPEFQGLRRWMLATADAHGVYAALGFEPLPNPERWMVRLPS